MNIVAIPYSEYVWMKLDYNKYHKYPREENKSRKRGTFFSLAPTETPHSSTVHRPFIARTCLPQQAACWPPRFYPLYAVHEPRSTQSLLWLEEEEENRWNFTWKN